MIGVAATFEEFPAVAEFFELFKTPWERFCPGKAYDVVLTTLPRLDEVRATVLLVYGAGETEWDAETNRNQRNHRSGLVRFQEENFPVYGALASFGNGILSLANDPGCDAPVAVQFQRDETTIIRVGYDLFAEITFLLTQGQPPENAMFCALDQHIAMLRQLIIRGGIPIVEIPPAPFGTRFIACLTHDIDFFSIRQHKFDRTMGGFLFRATCGAATNFGRGRIGFRRLASNFAAAAKLPLVHLGLCSDFWVPFDRYRKVDGRPATFFLIPFKNRSGQSGNGGASTCRATRYDIGDLGWWIPTLRDNGCELALHGIDAWHDVAAAKTELRRFCSVVSDDTPGVRMHWLYFSPKSHQILEEAGFDYDATCGYNDAVGYRAGTAQVFKPFGVERLLELPFQIQDTALFFPDRMNLAESEAWKLCVRLLRTANEHGGVLTLSWHDRSLVPERLWGEFYARLLKEVEAAAPWFGTAKEVVHWFRQRRAVRFAEVQRFDDHIEVSLQNVPTDTAPDFGLRISWMNAEGSPAEMEFPLQGRQKILFDLSDKLKLLRPSCANRKAQRDLCGKEHV